MNDSISHSTDSIALDSAVVTYTPKYVDGFPDSSGNNLDIQHIDQLTTMTEPAHSISDNPHYGTPLSDNITMLLVLAVIFTICINYGKGYKYVADFFHNMFSIKKRQNMFEDHTVKETQIETSLIANTCIFEGILLYEAFSLFHPEVISSPVPVFVFTLALAIFAALFYLLQILLYNLLGFVFGDKVETKLWIDCFKASQSLLGILLAPITFILLVFPETIGVMLLIAVSFYALARLVFIFKGLRIFFNDFQSSFYFILYLCSVEFVPVILSFTGAMELCIILQAVL